MYFDCSHFELTIWFVTIVFISFYLRRWYLRLVNGECRCGVNRMLSENKKNRTLILRNLIGYKKIIPFNSIFSNFLNNLIIHGMRSKGKGNGKINKIIPFSHFLIGRKWYPYDCRLRISATSGCFLEWENATNRMDYPAKFNISFFLYNQLLW